MLVADSAGNVKSAGDRILNAINDAMATYPVTIDPVCWRQKGYRERWRRELTASVTRWP